MKKLLGMIVVTILAFGIFPVNSISAEAGRKYQIKITVMNPDGTKPVEYTYDDITSEESRIRRFTEGDLITLGDNYLHDIKYLNPGYPAYGVKDTKTTDDTTIDHNPYEESGIEHWFDVLKETSGTEIGFTIIFNGGGVGAYYPVKANLVCSGYYSISATANGGTVSVQESALSGEKVEVVPEAEEGRILDSLTYCVAGGQPEEIAESEGSYFFDMPAGDVEINAIFKLVPQVTAPEGLNLKYNGEDQKLIKEGQTDGGTLIYSLDDQTYSTAIPEQKDPGTYTVYYKVEGDDEYFGSEAASVEATIGNGYYVASGNKSSWEKGSSDPLEFVFKSDFEDEGTYNRFTDGGKILADGEELSSENYEASSGSLNIKLKSSYLGTLSLGEHTLQAEFFDGSSDKATFTIEEKQPEKKDDTPSDDSSSKPSVTYKLPKTGIE